MMEIDEAASGYLSRAGDKPMDVEGGGSAYFMGDQIDAIRQAKRNPEKAPGCVEELINRLNRAIKAPGDGEVLCEHGRNLVLGAVLASIPNVWTRDRIKRAKAALLRAITAAAGTDFEWNCTDRPCDFMVGLITFAADDETKQVVKEITAELKEELTVCRPVCSTIW